MTEFDDSRARPAGTPEPEDVTGAAGTPEPDAATGAAGSADAPGSPDQPATTAGPTPVEPAPPVGDTDTTPLPPVDAAGGAYPPPGAQPPPGAAPPPGGHQGAFAARYGLVRPRTGRYLAGVSGAVARATNTDPVLWRVLFVVLAFFGGFGILAYIVLWLATPADGDTASPAEAVFGRGRSSTSATLTVIAGVVTVMIFVGTMDGRPWPVLWFLLIAGAIVFAVAVQNRNKENRPAGAPAAYPAASPYPAAPAYPAASSAATASYTAAPYPPAPYASAPAAPSEPTAATPPGYQPAFAPHGPYATPPVPPVTGKPPKPPKPPKDPSRLSSLIFSVGLVVLGTMGLFDVADVYSIPGSAYVAAALAVVGAGLLLGAWLGRARGMIIIGIILAFVLTVTAIDEDGDGFRPSARGGGEVTWQPATLAELRGDYDHQFGSATLDLRDLDFTGQERTVRVQIEGGDLQVLLPDDVDLVSTTNVQLGNADVLDRSANGVRIKDFVVTDLGDDGAGGGKLNLELDVRMGNAEVTR